MEKAKVTNFGRTRSFPTCVGDIRMMRLESLEVGNPRAAKELSRFPYVKVEFPQGDPSAVDYSNFSIQELRKLASSYGIKKTFTMRKKDLIGRLNKI